MSFKFFVVFLIFVQFVVFSGLNFIAEAGNSNTSVTVIVAQCADSVDNDGDSLIDYPADPGCSSAVDDDETDSVQPSSSGPTPTITLGPGGYGLPSIKPTVPIKILRTCDFNGDNKCNIIDFSVLLFYADKPIEIASRYDLNNDGKINLVDVSILFYYWA